MRVKRSANGFTLLEVTIGVAIFLIFAVGVYSAMSLVFKMVYQSRLRVLETAVATEQIEVIRNLPFSSVGVVNGVPAGVLSAHKNILRSGVSFSITTTVHNMDNPFDGTLTSTPADDDPADYKLVQVSVQCINCDQFKPVLMTTQISPKGLETQTNNGSLFIQVLNANGQVVPGATVQVRNNSTTPQINLTDITDNDGWLKLLDTPTGTLNYNITVSKSGYSSDYTIVPTVANPSPTKLPASVTSQGLTTAVFSIDQLGSMLIRTINPVCSVIGGIPFVLQGQKQIGSLPVVYKYNQTHTTNGAGEYAFGNAEWDTYNLSAVGTTYDLAGTIPMSPIDLLPGASQEVSLILKPHTSNSLLVKVKDSGTGLPLSGATVRLTGVGYDQTLYTGLGYIQQTDWSGGQGQDFFNNSQQYYYDDGRIDESSLPGDVILKSFGGIHLMDGFLESSTFDLGVISNFSNILINPTTAPTSTGDGAIRIHIATSNSSTPATWDFLGPDGTDTTYYTATNTVINANHNGNRYVRYRAYLQTEDSSATPLLSDVSITYTTSCLAPGQSFFNSLSSGIYNLEVNKSGYAVNSGEIIISGNKILEVNLSPL